MAENKKNETQVTSHSTATNSATPVVNYVKKQKKTCPALYPSKPHTSNK